MGAGQSTDGTDPSLSSLDSTNQSITSNTDTQQSISGNSVLIPDNPSLSPLLNNNYTGWKVLKSFINSPCGNSIVPYIDIIISVNGQRLTGDEQSLLSLIKEDQSIELTIYSLATHTLRTLSVIPNRRWFTDTTESKGLLGLMIRFDTFNSAEYECIHILDIQPNSPANIAGLVPYNDYLLGSSKIAFKGYEQLDYWLAQNENQLSTVFVFNSIDYSVREIQIHLNSNWKSISNNTNNPSSAVIEQKSLLGCNVGVGLLHKLPLKDNRPVTFDGNNTAGSVPTNSINYQQQQQQQMQQLQQQQQQQQMDQMPPLIPMQQQQQPPLQQQYIPEQNHGHSHAHGQHQHAHSHGPAAASVGADSHPIHQPPATINTQLPNPNLIQSPTPFSASVSTPIIPQSAPPARTADQLIGSQQSIQPQRPYQPPPQQQQPIQSPYQSQQQQQYQPQPQYQQQPQQHHGHSHAPGSGNEHHQHGPTPTTITSPAPIPINTTIPTARLPVHQPQSYQPQPQPQSQPQQPYAAPQLAYTRQIAPVGPGTGIGIAQQPITTPQSTTVPDFT